MRRTLHRAQKVCLDLLHTSSSAVSDAGERARVLPRAFRSIGSLPDEVIPGPAPPKTNDPVDETSASLLGIGSGTPAITSLRPGEAIREEAFVSVGAAPVVFETGRLARVADGSCVVSQGATTVMAVVVSSPVFQERSESLPLQVEYRERAYALGSIPKTFTRREGQPRDREVLVSRAIDRALRPLFPRGFHYDTQIVTSVLSSDNDLDPDVLCINAASAALSVSDIPFSGPVAAVRAAILSDGTVSVNPTMRQLADASLSLLLVRSAHHVISLDAQADQASEADLFRALDAAYEGAAALLEPQVRMAGRSGRVKRRVKLAGVDPAAAVRIRDLSGPAVQEVLRSIPDRGARERRLAELRTALVDKLRSLGAFRFHDLRVPGSGLCSPVDIEYAWEGIQSQTLREMAVVHSTRMDGRCPEDLRSLHCAAGAVARVHGSALFQAGESQVLATVTVGSTEDAQRQDSVIGPGSKLLMVDYTAPSYARNEILRRGPARLLQQRRELEHSNFVEKSLLPSVPSDAAFPFPIRVTAEALGAAGSTPLAAVSAGSLALRDASIPSTLLVAGASVGLMTLPATDPSGLFGGCYTYAGEAGGNLAGEPDPLLEARLGPVVGLEGSGGGVPYALLSDLIAGEDRLGDMELKVAGSERGLTAVQMATRLSRGVPLAWLKESVLRSREGRAEALGAMASMGGPSRVGADAPKFGTVTINKDLIARLIGERGENIRSIQEETGARVATSDIGAVSVYGPSGAMHDKAVELVMLVEGGNIRIGQIMPVTVLQLKDFGAFVELPNGLQALLHVSEVSHARIRAVEDVLKVGETLEVMCIGKDNRGLVKLSRKALLPAPLVSPLLSSASASSAQEGAGSVSVSATLPATPAPQGLAAGPEAPRGLLSRGHSALLDGPVGGSGSSRRLGLSHASGDRDRSSHAPGSGSDRSSHAGSRASSGGRARPESARQSSGSGGKDLGSSSSNGRRAPRDSAGSGSGGRSGGSASGTGARADSSRSGGAGEGPRSSSAQPRSSSRPAAGGSS